MLKGHCPSPGWQVLGTGAWLKGSRTWLPVPGSLFSKPVGIKIGAESCQAQRWGEEDG